MITTQRNSLHKAYILAKIIRLFYLLLDYYVYACKMKFVLKDRSDKQNLKNPNTVFILITILIFLLVSFYYLANHEDCSCVYCLYTFSPELLPC